MIQFLQLCIQLNLSKEAIINILQLNLIFSLNIYICLITKYIFTSQKISQMIKPSLKQNTMPSTALTKSSTVSSFLKSSYRYDNRHSPLTNATKISSQTNPSLISSFRLPQLVGKRKYQTQRMDQKNNDKSKEFQNTLQIQNFINKRIKCQKQLSIQILKNNSFKYYYGLDNVFQQSIKSIPKQITDQIQKQKLNKSQIHFIYGYLTKCHSVFYIIQQQLFIVPYELLQTKQYQNQNQNNLKINQVHSLQKTQIRPNCSNIHELQIQNQFIPIQFQNKILAFQYPYQIQICSYRTNFIYQNGQSDQNYNDIIRKNIKHQKNKIKPSKSQKKQIILITFDFIIPTQSIYAKFIKSTQSGDIIYVDYFGNVNLIQLKGGVSTNNKQKVSNIKQSIMKKKNFLYRNQSLLKMAKCKFRFLTNTFYSLSLSKLQIVKMVYDQKRHRIYTLALKPDRRNVLPNNKKIIKVYDIGTEKNITNFYNKQIKCIWEVEQKSIVRQICQRFNFQNKDHTIFTIQKVNIDHNLQSDLIIVFQNGTQIHLQITLEQIKSIDKLLFSDYEKVLNISNQLKIKQLNLQSYSFSDLNQNIRIPFLQNKTIKLKAFYRNRRVSLGYIYDEKNKKSHFYVTQNHYYDSQRYMIKNITWQNQFNFNSTDIPQQNNIYQMDSSYLLKAQADPQKTSNSSLDILTLLNQQNQKQPKIQYSHQLLRQIYFPTRNFIYITNKFITQIWILRPIDMIYMYLRCSTEEYNKKYLTKIFNLNLQEICSMLIQIYCQRDAVYYRCPKYQSKIHSIVQNQSKLENLKYQNISLNRIEQKNQNNRNAQNRNINKCRQNRNINKYQQNRNINRNQQNRNINKCRQQQKQQIQRLRSKIVQDYQNIIIGQRIKQFQQIKIKIERLFLFYTSKQKKQKIDIFEQINIKQKKPLKQQNVTVQDGRYQTQIKYVNLYISRVMYPFWNYKFIDKLSKITLNQIRNKVETLKYAVQLLKQFHNQKYRSLQFFVVKTIQLLWLFQYVNLSNGLTLNEALSKNFNFFESSIFNKLKRENTIQIIQQYKRKFSIYISQQFEILMRIYGQVDRIYDDQMISDMLSRLPQYPYYFIQYLQKQKKFKDAKFIKTKQQNTNQSLQLQLQLPDNLPFINTIQFFIQKITKKSIILSTKLQYLSQLKLKLQSSQGKVNQALTISSSTLRQYKNKYQYINNCLKIQQQCRTEIMKMIKLIESKQQQKEISQRNQQQTPYNIIKSYLFKNYNHKISIYNKSKSKYQYKAKNNVDIRLFLNSMTNNQDNSNNNLNTINNDYQGRYIDQAIKINDLREILNCIDYNFLQTKSLQDLIKCLNCPRIIIAFNMIFGQNAQQMRGNYSGFNQSVIQKVKELIEETIIKYVNQNLPSNQKFLKSLQQLNSHLRSQFRSLAIIIRNCNRYVDFGQIYQGYQKGYLNFNTIKNLIIQNQKKHIFLIAIQLKPYIQNNQIENYFKKQINRYFLENRLILQKISVEKHYFQSGNREQSNRYNAIRQDFNNQKISDNQQFMTRTQKWVLKWYNYLQFIISYRRQDLPWIYEKTKDFYNLTKQQFQKDQKDFIFIVKKQLEEIQKLMKNQKYN